MSLTFQPFTRKPFEVRAVEITAENIDEIGSIIGVVKEKPSAADPEIMEKYIAVNRAVIPQIGKAYIGWFLTEKDDNYQCYSPRVFANMFEPVVM